MSEKSLLDQWRDMAYDRSLSKDQLEKFWGKYFTIEREIYEQLLEDPDTEVKGTVKELAEKYGQDVMTMVGFLDGINESLKVENPIETMTEDTEVSLALRKNCIKTWSMQRLTGSTGFPSGRRSLTRRRGSASTASRKLPARCASRRRSGETTRVRAAAARNIKSAAGKTHK